jgi:hypothetical protein
MDLIEYEIRSTQRYLNDHNRLFQLEKMILRFINKSKNTALAHDKSELYGDLLTELDSMKGTEFERNILHYFDLSTWINNRQLQTPE